MGFEMGRVDHDPFGIGSFPGQASKYPVRTIFVGRVLPLQSVTDHVDDPAYHAPVVNPRFTVRARKVGTDPSHLSLAQQKQLTHGGHLRRSQNHGLSSRVELLMGPEPSTTVAL